MNNITFQNAYQTSTAAIINLGTRAMTPDGREWVYSKAVSALAKGSVAVPNAVTSASLVSSSNDALARTVFITKASAGWTTGAFIDGWVVVDTGTGVGQAGRIKSNTTDTLELYPDFALATALSVADSGIKIRTMHFVTKSAITVKIQSAVGIAQTAFATNDFGWLLTDGEGVVLAGSALTVGGSFVAGDATTGQVVPGTTAKGAFDEQSLGFCLVAAGTNQLHLVRVVIR